MNFYQVLGLRSDASQKDVRLARRNILLQLERESHLQKNACLSQKWAEINIAFDCLINPTYRSIYDSRGYKQLQEYQQEEREKERGDSLQRESEFDWNPENLSFSSAKKLVHSMELEELKNNNRTLTRKVRSLETDLKRSGESLRVTKKRLASTTDMLGLVQCELLAMKQSQQKEHKLRERAQQELEDINNKKSQWQKIEFGRTCQLNEWEADLIKKTNLLQQERKYFQLQKGIYEEQATKFLRIKHQLLDILDTVPNVAVDPTCAPTSSVEFADVPLIEIA